MNSSKLTFPTDGGVRQPVLLVIPGFVVLFGELSLIVEVGQIVAIVRQNSPIYEQHSLSESYPEPN